MDIKELPEQIDTSTYSMLSLFSHSFPFFFFAFACEFLVC